MKVTESQGRKIAGALADDDIVTEESNDLSLHGRIILARYNLIFRLPQGSGNVREILLDGLDGVADVGGLLD